MRLILSDKLILCVRFDCPWFLGRSSNCFTNHCEEFEHYFCLIRDDYEIQNLKVNRPDKLGKEITIIINSGRLHILSTCPHCNYGAQTFKFSDYCRTRRLIRKPASKSIKKKEAKMQSVIKLLVSARHSVLS